LSVNVLNVSNVGLKDSDGTIFDSIIYLVSDMESGSNTNRAPTENKVPPSRQTPLRSPSQG